MGEAKILIVEDELIVAHDIESKLVKMNYDVIGLAQRGEQAIELALEKKPDLILMDIKLSGDIDGIEANRRIQEKMDVPVVYLTAYGNKAILDRATQTKPYGYLVKPFKENELKGTIMTTLYRHNVEQKIKGEQKWLFDIFQSIGEAVVVTDNNFEILFINPIACEIINCSSKEVLGKDIAETFQFFSSNYDSFNIRDLSKETVGSYCIAKDALVKFKDKTEKEISFCLSTISDESNQSNGFVVVFRDVTKQKEAERFLKQSKQILEQKVAQRTNELTKINKKMGDEIAIRRRAQTEAMEAKENLKNIIDSSSELIFSFDLDRRLKSWNRSASQLTGFSAKEVKGRYLHKLPFFVDNKAISEMITDVSEKKNSIKERIVVESKKGEKRVLSLLISPLQDSSRNCIGTLFIGRDITTSVEMHKFLVFGNSYLLCESDAKKSFSLLIDMVDESTHGLFISRIHSAQLKTKYSQENLHFIGIGSLKNESLSIVESLEELKEELIIFCKTHKKCVVLLDAAHFFFTKFSFETFTSWLFEITEHIYLNKSLLFVRVDPDLIDKRQESILKNELKIPPSQDIDNVKLNDELAQILVFIKTQNENNSLVPLKKIMSEFDIVYLTAAKRIGLLEEKGLVFTRKQGKAKMIFISEKGKNVLNKRERIG